MTSRLLVTAAALLSPICLPAQTLQLARTGGTLGQTLTVKVSGGPANKPFLVLPSLNAGPTPLRLLDGRDTRSLEAGLDLLALLPIFVGVTRNSPVNIALPLPNEPGLSGSILHFHGFQFPGTTTFASVLSNPIRSTIGTRDTWVQRSKVYSEARALAAVGQLPKGSYLLAGGGAGNLLSARGLLTSEIYDPDRQTFRKGPNMRTARALMRSVTLNNGKVLIVGGVDSQGNPLRTCELYDPNTNRFTATGSMRLARAGHTANLLPNGNVLVCGGSPNFADALSAINNAQRSTEIYNTSTGTFSNGPNMSRPRLAHASVELNNGQVLVGGGATYTTFIIKIPGITSRCEIYNPSTNRWSGTGSMPYSSAAHIFTKLPNGGVLVSGGARLVSVTDIRAVNSAATYSSGRWSSTANTMAVARAAPTTALLPNGRVLVIGGATGSLASPGATRSCEFFDFRTRRFTPAPSLAVGRAGAHVFVLPEGPIYVTGGGGGTGNQALDSGEMLFQ